MSNHELDADTLLDSTPDIHPTERRDEKYARLAYDRFLKESHPGAAVSWAKGAEPPDYEVRVDRQVEAVEVTQVGLPCVESSGKVVSDRALSVLIARICDEVRDLVLRKAPATGFYLISFDEPFRELRTRSKRLAADAAAFILESGHARPGWEHELSVPPGPEVSIRLLSAVEPSHDLTVTYATHSWAGGWESDILEQLDEFLPDVVQRKAFKLRKVTHRRVLLLLDTYHVATPEHFKQALAKIREAREFDSIVLIRSPGIALSLDSPPAPLPRA